MKAPPPLWAYGSARRSELKHLTSSVAVAAQERVNRRVHQKGLLLGNYHFCRTCQKITENISEHDYECCFCGSHRLKWCPSIDT